MATPRNFPGQPVLILGVGRCGTSFSANFLQVNGIDLGTDLLEGGPINPRGFFEDRRLVAFHQGLLTRRGLSEAEPPLLYPLENRALAEEDKAEAIRILDSLAKPGFWGWKDPRTLHFIDFWLELLPHAKCIIPIRHPLEVFYSYLKRLPVAALVRPGEVFFSAIAVQFERLLEIAQRNGPRIYVLEAQAAFRQPARLWSELSAFLEISDRQPAQFPQFHDEEFTRLRLSQGLSGAFSKLFPRASDAFWGLNDRAGIPWQFFEEAGPYEPAFTNFVNVAAAEGRPMGDECLPLLLRYALEPEQEGYFQHMGTAFAKSSAGLAEALAYNRYLTGQVRTHQAAIGELEAKVADRSRYVSELEQSAAYLADQVEKHAAALGEHVEYIGRQADSIQRLEEGKKYLEGQLESHARALREQADYIASQADWIKQLEEAKADLERQCRTNSISTGDGSPRK